jgi:hypothetical protein
MPVWAVGLYADTSWVRFSLFLFESGIIGGALVVYGLGTDRLACAEVRAPVRERPRVLHLKAPQ